MGKKSKEKKNFKKTKINKTKKKINDLRNLKNFVPKGEIKQILEGLDNFRGSGYFN